MLGIIGVNGLQDVYATDGTFTRVKIFNALKDFALKSNKVSQFPGNHSLWIIDGASIHCEKNIVDYFRDLGIVIIYLPAYCAFFNPIEIFIGLFKKKLKRKFNPGNFQERFI